VSKVCAGAVPFAVDGDFRDASGEDDAAESGVGDFRDASGGDDAVESGAGASVGVAEEGADCDGSCAYWSWAPSPWANAVAPRITIARVAETVITTSRPMNPEAKFVRLMPLFP
jgi:hypothetical protein